MRTQITEDPDQPDIIQEALLLFRANSFFRNFEIKGPADRLLIYLILFISDCLGRLGTAKSWSQNEALKQLSTHAVDSFALPGEAGFPLNNLYAPPGGRLESGLFDFCVFLLLNSCALTEKKEKVCRPTSAVLDTG